VRGAAEASLPSLNGALEWFNSKPLTPQSLRGNVVVIDFWTYTCVNWSRTLPYVRAWYEKYRADGLVVIGVHTPEFSFEKNLSNIREAIHAMHIDYPVAVDSEYAIWNAFHNQYWPALYIVDADGTIRYHHFGEGAYAESEQVIQRLLVEAGHRDVSSQLVSVHPSGLELSADLATLDSAETYAGYARTENFASPGGIVPDRNHSYAFPAELSLNSWALSGSWTMGNEFALLDGAGGKVAFRFHARDVNLIMSPHVRETSIPFRVLLDGRPPGAAHGDDVNADGVGIVKRQGTYQLIRQRQPIDDRTFEIEFLSPHAEVFDFTFG
jgi:thiol-disulfide isomerase/thioredoxin